MVKKFFDEKKTLYRTGAMSSNPVVPILAYLRIDWFNCSKSQKSSGSIASFSKIEWLHGTTGTTTNAGSEMSQYAEAVFNKTLGTINKTYPGLISMLQGFQKCIA